MSTPRRLTDEYLDERWMLRFNEASADERSGILRILTAQHRSLLRLMSSPADRDAAMAEMEAQAASQLSIAEEFTAQAQPA